MIKLTDLLIKENFGGPGKMVLPANHKAGLKVPKGGSCCANCLHWYSEEAVCSSKHYIQWAGTNTIPYAADEYCTNWWEPIPAKTKEEPVEETTYHTMGLKPVRVVIDGEDVPKKHEDIIKALKDLDPDNTLKFFPATGKIVGNFAEVRIKDKAAQKRISDRKIKATIVAKPSNIK